MTASETQRTIDAIWRIESAKLIAGLARLVRDLGAAEDLAQEALVAALQQWPNEGIPDNPAGWLMAAAKHRALDAMRRKTLLTQKHDDLRNVTEEQHLPDLDASLDDDIGDDLLRLVFTSCHPVLSVDARVALTLRLLGGLKTEEIARAFLVPEATIAQRIVRAKKTLFESKVPFDAPRGPALQERLGSVLQVIYLIFNEGYSSSAGDDWMRPELCDDALRLGRIVVGLIPTEPEAHALVALMELQASRTAARVTTTGVPILLLEQNRMLWNQMQIHRGLASLNRVERLGGANGVYALQAAIAACHARAKTADDTDWKQIAALYATLAEVAPSPVVELNRAVAVSMADGPRAALEIIDALADDPSLAGYHWLPSVRGDLLLKLGRVTEAKRELERAAQLTHNARERSLLLERAAACQ